MPDEEKNNLDPETGDQEQEVKKSSPLKKYGIYAGIVLVMMAAAYFVTLKVVKPMFADGGEKITEEQEPEEPEDEHQEESSHGHGEKGENNDIFLVEGVIVNPAGTGGRRFLSTSIGFKMASPKASALIEARQAIVRDALITILSSQSIPELSDFKQKERLRKLIKMRVEKLLETKDIDAVYFTEFVLQ